MSDAQPPRRALAGQVEPIPAEVIGAIGLALFGRDWVSPLADALGVNRVTVQRWKDGSSRVTPRIAPELAALLESRGLQLQAARKALAPYT